MDTLERVTDSFIDEQLQEHFADMLYKCQLKDTEEEIMISILLEHKSYNNHDTDFQMLGYVHNGWQQDVKQGRKRQFILPIVLYHGTKKWKRKSIINHFEHIGKQFIQFIQFIPKFEYVLIDFSQFSEEEILNMHVEAMVVNMAMVFKYGRNENYVVNYIDRIFYRAQEYYDVVTGKNFLDISFVYILSLVENPEKNWKNILEKLPKPIKNTAMTLYDSILKKGEEQGIQKGMEQGIEQGMEQGIEQGIEQGVQQGFQNTLTIIQLLKDGQSPAKIAQKFNIDVEFVLEIRRQLNNPN